MVLHIGFWHFDKIYFPHWANYPTCRITRIINLRIVSGIIIQQPGSTNFEAKGVSVIVEEQPLLPFLVGKILINNFGQ